MGCISVKVRRSDITKTKLRRGLVEQLESNRIYGMHYYDLINDYISLWEIKNKLIQDIKDRGVTIKYQNGENQWGYRKNDSVNELNKTNAQMLKLLNELGLKATEIRVDDEDEDEEM